MTEKEQENKNTRKIDIKKIVLSCGATEDKLEKSVKLLKLISGKKPIKTQSKKRIPSLGVRPGLEIGCMVTIRGKQAKELLKRLLATINNEIKEKQIRANHFSFGIEEYIEIPGIEYQREIGILGFNVTVVFEMAGKRVKRKKIKRGKFPIKQAVKKREIIEFMEKNFQTEIIRREQR